MRRQSCIRKEPVVAKGITWVGLDAHKNSISVAMLLPRRKTAEEWKIANEPKWLRRLVRKIEREAPGEVRCCYEAGVCGFILARTLEGISDGKLTCSVIAPALIPKKAGDLHDFGRFESPRALMCYLGLVPGEQSSGSKTRRGAITKTGNKHVRRILIEASKHYRKQPTVGAALKKRREGQPAEAIRIADKAQTRLHRRYWRLVLKNNKNANKATVAVARELVGFVWAVLYPRAAEAGPGIRKAA